MSRFRRSVRYTRRRRSDNSSSKIVAIFAVIAVVLVCLILSVVIGIALGKKAEQYKSGSKYRFDYEPYSSGEKTVKAVDAFYYVLGADARGYVRGGEGDLSFCLRDAEGVLSFDSVTAENAGIAQSESGLSLTEEIEYLHKLGGYACAYICSTAFECEDEYLREIYKAYEIALISEAADAGVDDILIVGLEINADNISEIEKYVSDASRAAGNAPLGVLVSREIISAVDDGVYLAGRVRSACDYLALDLRAFEVTEESEEANSSTLEELIDSVKYYIEAYGLRMVLSRENSEIRSGLIELGVGNIQIIAE